MGRPDLVVVSNRGPVSWARGDDGALVAVRGGGGLASSLAPLLHGSGALWIAAAMSEEDREAVERGRREADGIRLSSLVFDRDQYAMAYDVVSNATLWFLYHGLFDAARRPRLDRRWHEAWSAYRAVNQAFARKIADEAPESATVLVQDYHLALVAPALAAERPDIRAVHFSHTPFCDPMALEVLPDEVAGELLEAMAAYASCGFHARRWSRAYEACAESVLGRTVPTFVSPLAPDPTELLSVAESDECAAEERWLESVSTGCKVIVRVDRIELSKNILRGFLAFDDLLAHRPEWRGKVVFIALVYPSRGGLPEYLSYRQEVDALARNVNARWGTAGWTPIVVDSDDNFPRSVAALRRYDVLLVNPVRDGLNLVAKEGPLVNENDGVLALSSQAGAWDELAEWAVRVNPFDIAGTSDALDAALRMDGDDRRRRADGLRAAIRSRTPQDWLDDQLTAARR